ncbi:hypothetical protein BD770DRAFT_392451 [Pilaira anomala]|nr:hypothetical protein BD770DRAFT_392451 [Pilaira anomala]
MTEYAIAPIMLTPQPPHVFQRRSSIRRGTIASISKDVRVNDIVEIIKKQKALTQQERGVAEESLLKRRHSMMNMNRSMKQNNNKRELRTRTLSISDLKGTAAWQQQQDATTATTTDKTRLEKEEIEEKQKKQQQQIVLYQHLRKCAACKSNEMCFSSEPEEEEEEEEQVNNSPSSSSSCSSSTDQNNCFQWQSSTLHNVEQREQILKNLNSSITDYSNTLKNLTHHPSDSTEYNLQIEKCKSFVQQQQLLLDQLLSFTCSSTKASSITSFDLAVPKTAPTPPPVNEKHGILSIYNALYKGLKSTTTGITIKQTKDKNELDTIISVQGVCTTIEPSLIPDRLLASKATDDITSFNQSSVYQHKYSLEITHQDRQTKFKLLEKDEWQKDENVKVCSFKNCNQPFNWFQRKHHCRGCGQIYCNTHSGNRLPLFSAKETHHPVFSRVCDKCFYQLATDSLY